MLPSDARYWRDLMEEAFAFLFDDGVESIGSTDDLRAVAERARVQGHHRIAVGLGHIRIHFDAEPVQEALALFRLNKRDKRGRPPIVGCAKLVAAHVVGLRGSKAVEKLNRIIDEASAK